jgi:hypothetical protein
MKRIHCSTATAGKAHIRAHDLGISIASGVGKPSPQIEAMCTGISQELVLECPWLRKVSALDKRGRESFNCLQHG